MAENRNPIQAELRKHFGVEALPLEYVEKGAGRARGVRKRSSGRIYCAKHGKPLYLQIEGAAVCVKGCRIVFEQAKG